MLSGYRGFLHEIARTGSWRSLALMLRTGSTHVVRRLLRRTDPDAVTRFLDNYAADGFRLPDREVATLQLAAEACLVCGLCSAECARVGGAPGVDPRDAVIAASRLAIDWVRLELGPLSAPRGGARDAEDACAGCSACEAVCPAGIPIARVQRWLAARP